MQYAINICDLSSADFVVKSILVAPHVQGRTIVQCEPGRVDGGSILMECPEEQAKAIVHVIRTKHHKNLMRCYESKTGKSWKRI